MGSGGRAFSISAYTSLGLAEDVLALGWNNREGWSPFIVDERDVPEISGDFESLKKAFLASEILFLGEPGDDARNEEKICYI